MNNITYTLAGIEFSYGDTPVITGVDLDFKPGQLHAIVGPNGSGKSTLLDLMSGHLKPSAGSININGTPLTSFTPEKLAQTTALVPQEFDFNFPFTVQEAVLMGRHPHIPRFSRPSDTDLKLVERAMTTMDTANLAERILADLSGGEKQRTIFARALAQDTSILLLDEPTSSMDIRHALAAMSELKRLAHEHGCTVVTVLHDLNLAAAFCDRIVMLKAGQVHAQGNAADTLTVDTIADVFGVTAEVIESSNGLTISYGIKE